MPLNWTTWLVTTTDWITNWRCNPNRIQRNPSNLHVQQFRACKPSIFSGLPWIYHFFLMIPPFPLSHLERPVRHLSRCARCCATKSSQQSPQVGVFGEGRPGRCGVEVAWDILGSLMIMVGRWLFYNPDFSDDGMMGFLPLTFNDHFLLWQQTIHHAGLTWWELPWCKIIHLALRTKSTTCSIVGCIYIYI